MKHRRPIGCSITEYTTSHGRNLLHIGNTCSRQCQPTIMVIHMPSHVCILSHHRSSSPLSCDVQRNALFTYPLSLTCTLDFIHRQRACDKKVAESNSHHPQGLPKSSHRASSGAECRSALRHTHRNKIYYPLHHPLCDGVRARARNISRGAANLWRSKATTTTTRQRKALLSHAVPNLSRSLRLTMYIKNAYK